MTQVKRVVIPETQWRMAVRKLGLFTVSELAAELGCSKHTTKVHLDEMAKLEPPLVEPAGHLGRAPMFRYIKPTDAGERFHRQQEMQAARPPEQAAADLAVVRGTAVRQSRLGSVRHKEIREVCREAIGQGWDLVNMERGEHALKLVKGDAIIDVPNSPRNAGNAAQILRQKLKGRAA